MATITVRLNCTSLGMYPLILGGPTLTAGDTTPTGDLTFTASALVNVPNPTRGETGYTRSLQVYKDSETFGTPSTGNTVTVTKDGSTGVSYTCVQTESNYGGSDSTVSAAVLVGAVAAPTITASDALADGVLTISVDSLSGVPTPSVSLTTMTLDAVDVSGDVVTADPWDYTVPVSEDSQTVAWELTATNSQGSDTASGSEVVPGTAPTATVSLAAQTFTEGTGTQTYNASGAFSGPSIVYSVNSVTGVSINSSTGVVSVDTDSTGAISGTTITVTATNNAGSDTASFALTVQAAATSGPTVVSSATTQIASGQSSATIDMPPNLQQGDAVVLSLAGDWQPQSYTPSAADITWTAVHSANTGVPAMAIFVGLCGASPASTATIDMAATQPDPQVALAQAFRGVEVSNIQDVAAVVTSGTTGMPDCGSITTVTDNALVIAAGFLDDDQVASSVVAPSGYTNLVSAEVSNASSAASIFMASKVVSTAGAENPAAFTDASGDDAWIAVTLALRASGESVAATVPDAFTAGDWTLTNPATDGDLTVTISSLPANNGAAITDIEYRLDAGTWTSSGGTTSFGISGLTNSTSYDVEIRAINSAGNGATSDTKTNTPTAAATVPDAFTAGMWSAADAQTGGTINVAIGSLPANNGATITDIEYQLDAGSWVSTGGTGAFAIGSLTDDQAYDIAIRAVNSAGNSAASDTKTRTPTTASGSGATPSSLETTTAAAITNAWTGTEGDFSGFTSTTGFTTTTVTTADELRTAIEGHRANWQNNGRLLIECNWDGNSSGNSSWRGPSTAQLTADATAPDGSNYARGNGAIWIRPASGKTPAITIPTIFITGMPRLFIEGMIFNGSAAGQNPDTTYNLFSYSSGTFPIRSVIAVKDCTFGLADSGANPGNYPVSIKCNNTFSLHIEDNTFNGTREAAQATCKYFKAIRNRVLYHVSDVFHMSGLQSWAGDCYALVEYNVCDKAIQNSGLTGLHTDFFQYGTYADAHTSYNVLVQNNLYHMATYDLDSNSQGVYGDDCPSPIIANLVVRDNVLSYNAYWMVSYHSPGGTGACVVARNIGARSGLVYEISQDPFPRVIQTSLGSTQSVTNIEVTNNVLTSLVSINASGDTSGNVYVSPRRNVVTGDGTSDTQQIRHEDYFNHGTRDGSDNLTYTITGEGNLDYATAYHVLADHFRPQLGYANSGANDPASWSGAPVHP